MGLIERIVASSLRQRLFVLLCLAALIVTGSVAYRDLPVEAFPDLTNNQVTVVTEAAGLAATEVEQRVSYPIETALMGVPGADQVRSISKAGLSLVTVVFDETVPIYLARQLVNERVSEAQGRLPAGFVRSRPVGDTVRTTSSKPSSIRRGRWLMIRRIWFFAGTSAMYGVVGQASEAFTLLGAIVPLVLMDVFLHPRTQASTEGLKSRLASRATVVRDGVPIEVAARDVVPG